MQEGITGKLVYTGLLGHLASSIGYLVLAAFAVVWSRRTLHGIMLLGAAAVTALWAAVTTYRLYADASIGPIGQSLEVLRSAGWMLLLLGMLYWLIPARRSSYAAVLLALCLAVLAATLLLGQGSIAIDPPPEAGGMGSQMVILGHLILAVIGLALVENLFRNTPSPRLWSVKHLCLGTGAMFAYDFFLYSDALLLRHIDVEVYLARGVTNLVIVPLFLVHAARNRHGGPKIALSRQFAFRSTTFVGTGFYLLTMAAAGYYVRRFGGTWSTFLQAVFFFGAVLLLVVPLSSRSFRANLRVIIEKSFFKYRYDYREEWLRFIKTISGDRSSHIANEREDLRERVIKAVCNLLESPEGGLWLRQDNDSLSVATTWNVSRWALVERDANFTADSSLTRFLEKEQWIIDVNDYAENPSRYGDLQRLPEWLTRISRVWLIIPLIHGDSLLGLMVLGRPRVERTLAWEDFDILKTVGRQAASYLALQASDRALLEARQFEAFNKRFAFVIHDIKNLVSQLSLILANTARHRGNADFHEDVIETVRESVEKLNKMLRQLHAQPQTILLKTVELSSLLSQVAANRGKAQDDIRLSLSSSAISVAGDEERIKTIIEHLVQNALDASGETGHVELRAHEAGKMAFIEIEDDGPGMDSIFIREELFRPFSTTKNSGYGIGVYESREYIKSLGGELDVFSEVGRGTIMRVSLPIIPVNEVNARAAKAAAGVEGSR